MHKLFSLLAASPFKIVLSTKRNELPRDTSISTLKQFSFLVWPKQHIFSSSPFSTPFPVCCQTHSTLLCHGVRMCRGQSLHPSWGAGDFQLWEHSFLRHSNKPLVITHWTRGEQVHGGILTCKTDVTKFTSNCPFLWSVVYWTAAC